MKWLFLSPKYMGSIPWDWSFTTWLWCSRIAWGLYLKSSGQPNTREVLDSNFLPSGAHSPFHHMVEFRLSSWKAYVFSLRHQFRSKNSDYLNLVVGAKIRRMVSRAYGTTLLWFPSRFVDINYKNNLTSCESCNLQKWAFRRLKVFSVGETIWPL